MRAEQAGHARATPISLATMQLTNINQVKISSPQYSNRISAHLNQVAHEFIALELGDHGTEGERHSRREHILARQEVLARRELVPS